MKVKQVLGLRGAVFELVQGRMKEGNTTFAFF